MLFEKSQKSINWIDLIGFTSIIIILSVSITFGFCTVNEIKDVQPKEIIDSVAQVSTALAFFLALFQYIKQSKEKRQIDIANEAKSQILKIISVVEKTDINENTNIENLNKSLTLLSNLAVNFEALFEEMAEDIQKAIVRMHWQDMYFNHLSHMLISLRIEPILKSIEGIDSTYLENIFTEARIESGKNIIPIFKQYVYVNYIISHEYVKNKFDLKKNLDSSYSFIEYYLKDENLNDHLYGLMSRVDIRAKAPLLAVIRSL